MPKEKANFCYLTGNKITAENSSLEHIIPNAIGGTLKSREVLCAMANRKLSLDIDNKFNEIFAGTYRRLPIEKDRQTNWGLVGNHVGYSEKVVLKDGKWFPWTPLYDSEKKIVYAQSHKIAEGFLRGMKKQGKIPENVHVATMDDMAGSIAIPFNLNNRHFVRGLAKIAAGFATLEGIKRADLNMIIDLENKEIRDEIVSLPYIPTEPFDMALEFQATNSRHYPIHALSLFNVPEDKALFCYIELFSTYQYILLLNDNYKGKNIHRGYIYSLLESTELSAPNYHKSILGDEQLMAFKARGFKNINSQQIHDIMEIMEMPENIRPYTFEKFHALEKFVAELDVANKLARLDRTVRTV